MTYEQIIANQQVKEESIISEIAQKIKSLQAELKARRRSLKNLQSPKFKETLLTALSLVTELPEEEREVLKESCHVDKPVRKPRAKKAQTIEPVIEPVVEQVVEPIVEPVAEQVVESVVQSEPVKQEEPVAPKLYGPCLLDEDVRRYPNGKVRPYPLEVHSDGSRCMTVENWNPDLPERFTAEEYLKLIGFKFYPSPDHPAPARKIVDGKEYQSTVAYDTPSLLSGIAYQDDLAASVQCENGTDIDFDGWRFRKESLYTAALDSPGRTFYKDGEFYKYVPLPRQEETVEEEKEPESKKTRGKKRAIKKVDEDDTEPDQIPKCSPQELLLDNYDGSYSEDKLKPYLIPHITPEELFKGEEVPPTIELISDNDQIYYHDPCFISKKDREGYTSETIWVMRDIYHTHVGCIEIPNAPGQHNHLFGFFGRNVPVRGISDEVARIIEYMAEHVDVNFKEAMEELVDDKNNYIWNLTYAEWKIAMASMHEGTNGALQMEFYIPKQEYIDDPDSFVYGDHEKESWADNTTEFCNWGTVRVRLVKVGRFPKNQEDCYNREVEYLTNKYNYHES